MRYSRATLCLHQLYSPIIVPYIYLPLTDTINGSIVEFSALNAYLRYGDWIAWKICFCAAIWFKFLPWIIKMPNSLIFFKLMFVFFMRKFLLSGYKWIDGFFVGLFDIYKGGKMGKIVTSFSTLDNSLLENVSVSSTLRMKVFGIRFSKKTVSSVGRRLRYFNCCRTSSQGLRTCTDNMCTCTDNTCTCSRALITHVESEGNVLQIGKYYYAYILLKRCKFSLKLQIRRV